MSTTVGNTSYLWDQIQQYAPAYGIDPQAALAVARVEGAGGGVGDSGTSFGPWQLHIGGALPSWVAAVGGDFAQTWAWSTDGIKYALSSMGQTSAKGQTGNGAVEAIVREFERPADPVSEIQRALAVLGLDIPGSGSGQPGTLDPIGPGIPLPPAKGPGVGSSPFPATTDTCTAPSIPFGMNPLDWKDNKASPNPGPTVAYYACVIAHDVQRVLIGVVFVVIVALGIWIFSQDKDAPDTVKAPVKLGEKGVVAAAAA